MELGYDKTTSVTGSTTFANARYDGLVSGTIWKTGGDTTKRKYDFSYDMVNRLSSANFVQNATGTTWSNTFMDFSVSNLKYDANGNILSMSQKGFKLTGPALIDSLSYSYQSNSNKLNAVNDAVNDTLSKLGDFHYSGSKSASDYGYDGNGNTISDNNRSMTGTTCNFLNQATQFTVTGKGTVKYVYDATGNRLQKITTDNTIAPAKTTTTTYIDGFVYKNDTLQFIGHEESRIRWAFHKYANGSTGYGFEYDYFLKDNLGNTRVVLTQQKDTAKYMATMESAYRNTENQLFYNIPQTSYARSLVSGYPTDATTNPNDSIARLNGKRPKARACDTIKSNGRR